MRSLVTLFALMIVFIGLHTGISIAPSGKMLMPFALSGFGALLILLMNQSAQTWQIASSFGGLIVWLLGMALITSFQGGDIGQHFISTAVFVYSITVAFETGVGIERIGLSRTRRMCAVVAIILIVGSVLELYAGLRPISDAFREAVNNWRSTYAADARDIASYGGVRPNFFASEPSVLGIMAGYSILFWFLAARRYMLRRLMVGAVLFTTAFIVIRSPTILVCGVATLVFYFSELFVGRRASKLRNALLSIVMLTGVTIIPIVVALLTNYGHTGSYFVRELAPPLIAARVLSKYPIFGAGLGGYSGITQLVLQSYSSSGAFARFSYIFQAVILGDSGIKHLISNQFWEFWIYFGIIGGGVILLIIRRLLGQMRVESRLLVLGTSALLMTMSGGIDDPIGWVGLFSIAAIYRLHQEARAEDDAMHTETEKEESPRPLLHEVSHET